MKMKYLVIAVAVFSFIACNNATSKGPADAKSMKTTLDSAAYAIGVDMGKRLKQSDFTDINAELIMTGMKDALKSDTVALTDEQMAGIFQNLNTMMNEKRMAKQLKEGEGNLKAAEEFLAKNKTKAGVKTTASGLQYEVIKEGNGAMPTATDKVKVHYHGTTISGDVFDSSVDRGEPIEFGLNQVIKGWTEGVQLMKVGSKYKFYIHPSMAYGAQSPSPKIPAQSMLIFEVELLGISK